MNLMLRNLLLTVFFLFLGVALVVAVAKIGHRAKKANRQVAAEKTLTEPSAKEMPRENPPLLSMETNRNIAQEKTASPPVETIEVLDIPTDPPEATDKTAPEETLSPAPVPAQQETPVEDKPAPTPDGRSEMPVFDMEVSMPGPTPSLAPSLRELEETPILETPSTPVQEPMPAPQQPVTTFAPMPWTDLEVTQEAVLLTEPETVESNLPGPREESTQEEEAVALESDAPCVSSGPFTVVPVIIKNHPKLCKCRPGNVIPFILVSPDSSPWEMIRQANQAYYAACQSYGPLGVSALTPPQSECRQDPEQALPSQDGFVYAPPFLPPPQYHPDYVQCPPQPYIPGQIISPYRVPFSSQPGIAPFWGIPPITAAPYYPPYWQPIEPLIKKHSHERRSERRSQRMAQ